MGRGICVGLENLRLHMKTVFREKLSGGGGLLVRFALVAWPDVEHMSPVQLPKSPVDLTWTELLAALVSEPPPRTASPPHSSRQPSVTDSCWQWSRGWGEGRCKQAPLWDSRVTPSQQTHPCPTTRRMRQTTSNLLLQRSVPPLCPVSHGHTRCPNNQTTAMIAEPSPKLIVLVCPIGSKWFLLLFLFVYYPPSPCLLGYWPKICTIYLFSICWGLPWIPCWDWLSGCWIPNLTPGYEWRGKHMWYVIPCVRKCVCVLRHVIDGICKKLSEFSKHLLANLDGNICLSRD